MGDVVVPIAADAWWRGPELWRHGNNEIHKVRGFCRRENPGAGSGWGETWHPQNPSKSDEGLELLLSDMDLPMVHIVEDRQDAIVLDTRRWRVARTGRRIART